MQVEVGWRTVLLLAFGGWKKVAEAAGVYKSTPPKWGGVPAFAVDRLLAHPDAPPWLTRDMLVRGARATFEPLPPAPFHGEAPAADVAPETMAPESVAPESMAAE